MSPTCCSPAPPPDTAKSPSAPRSALAAAGSCANCSPRACCSRSPALWPACCSRAWASTTSPPFPSLTRVAPPTSPSARLARLAALPGVQAAGLAHALPLVGDWVLGFNIEGRPPLAPSDLPNTNYYAVTPDYFRAMGIRLVRGRLFTARDDAQAPRV